MSIRICLQASKSYVFPILQNKAELIHPSHLPQGYLHHIHRHPSPPQTRKRHPRRRTHIEKLHQSDLNDKNKDCISLACRIRTPKPLALASPQSLPCLSQHLSYSAGVTMVSWPLSINEDNKMMLFVKFGFLQDLGRTNLP